MSRLFDSSRESHKEEEARSRQEEVRKRAAEAEKLIMEHQELDDQSRRIRDQLASTQAVKPIVYKEFRRPGSKWMIEHARDGEDYIYQLFPLKPPRFETSDVLQLLIIAMDVVFPRSVRIDYVPPNELYKAKMFTIKVRGVTRLPGWEDACLSKALNSLCAVEAWKVAE